MSMYFNPSIGLTSVPTFVQGHDAPNIKPFQSLNRAYKRSDELSRIDNNHGHAVSIPQSGLQAFRPKMIHLPCSARHGFNPSIGLTSVPTSQRDDQRDHLAWFQSLNRAYKRSDRGVRSGRDVKQLFQSLNRA